MKNKIIDILVETLINGNSITKDSVYSTYVKRITVLDIRAYHKEWCNCAMVANDGLTGITKIELLKNLAKKNTRGIK